MLRQVILGSLATLAITTTLAQAQNLTTDEARKVVQSVAETWTSTYDKHDGKAQSMLFVPDGVFLPPNGRPLAKGREALAANWAGLFKNVGGHETITVRDVIPVGNDAIVAVNEFRIVGDGANANKVISGRASIVLAKTPEGWKYVSIAPQDDAPTK